MEAAIEQEAAVEPVTFYASAGQRTDGGQYPSCMIVSIAGGNRMVGGNGIPTKAPLKEARFVNGSLTTDDPQIIRELRKMGKRDSAITEDYELYASRVMTKEQQIRRTGAKNEEMARENSRLKAKIAELQGKK